jgi:hypothetical protein
MNPKGCKYESHCSLRSQLSVSLVFNAMCRYILLRCVLKHEILISFFSALLDVVVMRARGWL